MADSKEKKNQKLSANFADDLDSMLDDAASATSSTEELMGDDDAIDQLLMDNALESEEQHEGDIDELDELFVDDSLAFNLDDEAEPELEPASKEPQSKEPLEDNTSSNPISEVDEFAEIDEFSDFDLDAGEPKPEPLSVTQGQEDNDFIVSEFDISYDDTTTDSIDNGDNSPEASGLTVELAKEQIDKPEIPSRDQTTVSAAAIDSTLAAQAAQISQLISEQDAIKQQLNEPSPDGTDHSEDIECLNKAQQAFKKQFEPISKLSTFAYTALGLAIVALLTAIALGFAGWNTSAEIEELMQRVVNLEDNQEAIIAKNNDKDINEMNTKIALQNQTLNELATQVNAFTGTDANGKASSPITTLNTELSMAISQQQTLNDSISSLDARIRQLETKTSPRSLKDNKTTGKKGAGNVSATKGWTVNLVSFRQAWYASRKAAEFAKKGISAEVVAVQVKGDPWYRLTVKGFKSKAKAMSYAAWVKKTLNLDSVWLDKE